ncbi:32 kDa beta-galactoside-binding lectin-like [Colossoma macropomum]|uniref:32 kDa beta-galactoside-binding lectin-like n=1 Tax=Colossoma macropomum TaxID=42526 RepID=UPI001863DDAE|nr:32 kDa beta-galactoside-binding lectin-like [Colossoma macropomum]
MEKKAKLEEVFLNVLGNLKADELKSFQRHLVWPLIPECKIKDTSIQETVKQLTEFYDDAEAAKITEITFKRMKKNQLTQKLQEALWKRGFFPEVPYEQALPEGLKNQRVITIHGLVKHKADRFTIDICKGDDIAFHFNPRFNDNGKQVIVRNSLIGGVWGPEERELPVFPFTPGKPFEIKIFCTSSEFIVEVDNKHLLTFAHRIRDIEKIKNLSIHRDVYLKYVDVGGFFPKVPYEQALPEGLKNQTVITIHGLVKHKAERFTIDICKGPDIAFHFNPRFNEDGKQVIVRNSLIGGVWGSEERELPFFPFRPGKPFELKILCTSSDFRVEVDKNHLLTYAHRISDLDKIKNLSVHRDVFLKYVDIALKA